MTAWLFPSLSIHDANTIVIGFQIESVSGRITPDFIAFPVSKSRALTVLDLISSTSSSTSSSSPLNVDSPAPCRFVYSPSGFQCSLLSHMRWQRRLVGHKTGLLVLATALGKTVLTMLDLEAELVDLCLQRASTQAVQAPKRTMGEPEKAELDLAMESSELEGDTADHDDDDFVKRKSKRPKHSAASSSSSSSSSATAESPSDSLVEAFSKCSCHCSIHRHVVIDPSAFDLPPVSRQHLLADEFRSRVLSQPSQSSDNSASAAATLLSTVRLPVFQGQVPPPPPLTSFRCLFLVHSKAIRDSAFAKFQQVHLSPEFAF